MLYSNSHHLRPLARRGTVWSTERQAENANWITALAQDAINVSRQAYGHGLLSAPKGKALRLVPEGTALALKSCYGLTASGLLIGIDEEFTPCPAIEQSEIGREGISDIYVLASPTERIPYGEPDPDEQPLRQPFSLPSYKLAVLPQGELHPKDCPHGIKIAEATWKGSRIELLSYLPACGAVKAHGRLAERYQRYHDIFFQAIHQGAFALSKLRMADAISNPRKANLRHLGRKLYYYLEEHRFYYREVLKESRPIDLMEFCVRFSSRLYAILQSLENKEEVLQYWASRCHSSSGQHLDINDIELSLEQARSVEYAHYHLEAQFQKIDQFLGIQELIFKTLQTVNGAYDSQNNNGGFWKMSF